MSQPRVCDYPIDPLFTSRWSPRSLTGEAMHENDLMQLLEAARWAPSAYNVQPWRFIYALRDTPQWAPIFSSLNPVNQSWAQNASALVVIASDTHMVLPGKTERSPNRWHSFDCGSAWVSLAFQATLSGWSAHDLAGFNPEALRPAISAPADFTLETVVVIGKKGPPEALSAELQAREAPNARRPLTQTCFHGKWS